MPATAALPVVLMLSLFSLATPAHADPPSGAAPDRRPEIPGSPASLSKSAADALFEEARSLMLAGDHVDACPKLEESQRLDPAVGTLLHLGECFAKTGRGASAWRTFRKAMTAARAEGRLDREQVALSRAQSLEPDLARLQISVPLGNELPGLVVRANGAELPRSSWGAAIPVDAGPHVLEVSAPGYRSWRTEAAVLQLGGTVVVSVPILVAEGVSPGVGQDEGAPAVVPAGEDARARSIARDRVLGFSSLAAGGVFAAAGAGFGIAAIRSWGDARGACVDRVCTDEGVRDAASARTSARVSTALFAVGALGAATGVYFLVRRPATARASVWAAPTIAGAAVGGSFE